MRSFGRFVNDKSQYNDKDDDKTHWESVEDKENHFGCFKQKGIYQGFYKTIERTEEQALDSAFENDSQNTIVALGYQDICYLCIKQLGTQRVTSATVRQLGTQEVTYATLPLKIYCLKRDRESTTEFFALEPGTYLINMCLRPYDQFLHNHKTNDVSQGPVLTQSQKHPLPL